MDYTQITYERVGRVARVSLNRPQYRNPVGRICIEELDDAFAAAVDDPDVGSILLRAEGPHFSGGHDLGTPEKLKDDEKRPFLPGGVGTFQRSHEIYWDPGLRWRNLPIPTVAAVQGYCIWGGWMVIAMFDIIFAAEDAMFLPTRGQYCTVPWDVGIRKAKELLYEPRFMRAQEAREVGFVNRVLPPDELDDQALAFADRVAQNDPFDLRMIKLSINQAQDVQGFTNHAFAPTGMQESGSAQGMQLPSGGRRIAPIDGAIENLELARGIDS